MTQKEVNQSEWENPANWTTFTYNSARDSRFFVPKRQGVGVTMNFGHKGGTASLVTLLVVVGVTLMFFVLRK
jgi:uncharacterized membrane protein